MVHVPTVGSSGPAATTKLGRGGQSSAVTPTAGLWLSGNDSGGFCQSPATQLIHGGQQPEPATGAIVAPLFQNTTFVQPSVEDYLQKGYSYSRSGNPTVSALEAKLALLEGGCGASCFSTGMAATCTVFSAFLRPGDHVVLTSCSYGGTNRAARVFFSKFGISFSFVDFTNLAAVEAAVTPATKMVFSETPTNPTMTLADIEALSDICKRHTDARAATGGIAGEGCAHATSTDPGEAPGRRFPHQVIHVCDSTFATPLITKPFELGADVVIHSTTKFYDGHNLTTGGVVVCKAKDLHDVVNFHRNVMGNIMSPFVAWLTNQTLKTLHLRIERQSSSASAIALMLHNHPKVKSVAYPGLESFKQKQLADRQHKNGMHGGMIGFELIGGTEMGVRLMDSIPRPWSLCENLGSGESIITCPAVFTHANMRKEDRLAVGISDGFVRVSVGLEDPQELLDTLRAALEVA
eukprot:GHVT01021024.1.p1 GENE.GHVT01021024.1~~GHVT01021024.1.p1  ORF type:complete len:464 (+),score=79.55 GHVT01021024.1:39-1430(+)